MKLFSKLLIQRRMKEYDDRKILNHFHIKILNNGKIRLILKNTSQTGKKISYD